MGKWMMRQKEAELNTYIENNNILELYYLPEKYRYYNAAQKRLALTNETMYTKNGKQLCSCFPFLVM